VRGEDFRRHSFGRPARNLPDAPCSWAARDSPGLRRLGLLIRCGWCALYGRLGCRGWGLRSGRWGGCRGWGSGLAVGRCRGLGLRAAVGRCGGWEAREWPWGRLARAWPPGGRVILRVPAGDEGAAVRKCREPNISSNSGLAGTSITGRGHDHEGFIARLRNKAFITPEPFMKTGPQWRMRRISGSSPGPLAPLFPY